ncbi:unnamed protein product [Arctogadus glacialis]
MREWNWDSGLHARPGLDILSSPPPQSPSLPAGRSREQPAPPHGHPALALPWLAVSRADIKRLLKPGFPPWHLKCGGPLFSKHLLLTSPSVSYVKTPGPH